MDLVLSRKYIHEESDSDWDDEVDITVGDQNVPIERVLRKLERGLEKTLAACLKGPAPKNFHSADRLFQMAEYRPTEQQLPRTSSGLPIYGTVGGPRKLSTQTGYASSRIGYNH